MLHTTSGEQEVIYELVEQTNLIYLCTHKHHKHVIFTALKNSTTEKKI